MRSTYSGRGSVGSTCASLRERIGTVDVRLRMPSELTVSDYVLTGATQTVQLLPDRYDDRHRARVAELLEAFGLAAHRRPQRRGVLAGRARTGASCPRAGGSAGVAAARRTCGRASTCPAAPTCSTRSSSCPRRTPQLTSITVAHHLEELPATTTHVALLRDGRFVATGPADLLHDADALSECFGRKVRAFAVDGRWYAAATYTSSVTKSA